MPEQLRKIRYARFRVEMVTENPLQLPTYQGIDL